MKKMKPDPKDVPCYKCLCFPICKNQHIREVLYKCSLLNRFMCTDLEHFQVGSDYFPVNNNLKRLL